MEDFAKRFQGLNLKPEALKGIFNFLPYPLLLARHENGVRINVFVNEKFQEEIGYSIAEIPTIQDWFETAYPDAQYRDEIVTEWESRVQAAIQHDQHSVTLPAIIKTKRYGYQWYEVTSNFTGEISVVAFVNIQSVKASEKQLQEENLNRDRVLSILSHDLRSPIANLLALAQLFQNGQLTKEEISSVMMQIQSDASHGLELIDTLLSWTKSNFNKVSGNKELVDLKKLALHTADLYRYALRAKQIDLNFRFDFDMPFYSDAVILTIVMRNLISNAIKFTPTCGSITLETQQVNDKVFFSVTDSGEGMSEEYVKFITTRQPLSKEGTNREKGSGLGLRLCREFLPLIGATLEIKSQEKKGTSVFLICPLVLDPPQN